MSKENKAIALSRGALAALAVELDLHKEGRGTVGDPGQLRSFESHLKDILTQLESGHIPPRNMRKLGMGKAIVDCWPLDSKLGNLLCSAENAYQDL
ncbi:MAG: hypothetical protein IIA66_10025 [Planctomycetes bacterium]|nr:hypothetical protein [Planctomycetota bacterium]